MNNLIVNFHPFLVKQDILIYQDGACVKQDHITIEEVSEKVKEYCKIYNIDIVNLCGNKLYLNKFMKDIRTKFDNEDMAIMILSHNT